MKLNLDGQTGSRQHGVKLLFQRCLLLTTVAALDLLLALRFVVLWTDLTLETALTAMRLLDGLVDMDERSERFKRSAVFALLKVLTGKKTTTWWPVLNADAALTPFHWATLSAPNA